MRREILKQDMRIILPRGLEVDLDQIPNDLEEQVQKAFSEYTEMTNPAFMYHDKLDFIDCMVKKLHGNKDSEDAVMDAMKDYLEYEVKEYGTMNFKLREVLITDDFEEEGDSDE